MKINSHRSTIDSRNRAFAVMIGIAVNILLSLITYGIGLPIYLDAAGTIGVAFIGGLFPGIMTAIATNVICNFFDNTAIYFGIVNALIAIYAAWFIREKHFRSIKNIAVFIVTAGFISGGISSFIQWEIFGKFSDASIQSLIDSFNIEEGFPKFLLFTLVNILLNIFDKGLSLGIALLVLHFVPQEKCIRIRNSGWRQRPLTVDEMKTMDSISKDIRFSMKQRMTSMILIVAFGIAITISVIGTHLYFENTKQEKTQNAINATKFAASVITPEKIDDYIRYGAETEGYAETEELLYKIRDNASDVEYLYVLQIRKDGCYVAFDLDTEDTPAYEHGDKIEFEEAFMPYLPALFEGEEIEPIESDDITGWVVTAYYPIKDESGKCVAYVGADVSLSYMAGYMRDFVLQIFLVLAGSFVLILAYALWVTGIYMVYPINNIVAGVQNFIDAGTEQEQLDEAVRNLRAINIHTGDEVEKLYHAICDMAVNQTEQMRNIRRLAENTAKMQDGLIITMADLVENRDSDTGAHIQKTAAYVKIIVEGLKRKGYYAEKITPKFMSDVVRSAPLHDVGKINIPDSVLNKPGKLTDEEYAIIKTHTTAGKQIMEKAISTVEGENYLKEERNMAAYHHERWDGKGYPEGLHGEVIPLAARIMAVADVFDALASPRIYKPAFPLEKALSIIQEGAGTQFDPKCVEVFMEALPEVKAVLKKYQQDA